MNDQALTSTFDISIHEMYNLTYEISFCRSGYANITCELPCNTPSDLGKHVIHEQWSKNARFKIHNKPAGLII